MKEERKTIFIGSIFNFLVASIKFCGGIAFQINSLIIDSIYTFCDFTTDIISIVGSKLAGKRPTKYHPFGFGRVEYLTNLFIGILMVMVSTTLFMHSFQSEYEIPNISILGVLAVAMTIKIFMLYFLKMRNKKHKSPQLADGIEESTIDLISTILVTISVILLQFSNEIYPLRYCDIIASCIISIMILRTSWQLIKNNILNLLGTVEVNAEITQYIKDEIQSLGKIDVYKVELIKYGRYYKIHLVIGLDGNITLKKAKKIQQKIIMKLKKQTRIKIKVVNVDLDLRKD